MIVAIDGRTLLQELRRHFEMTEAAYERREDRVEQRNIKRLEPISGPIELEVWFSNGLRQTALLADISVEGARLIADYAPPRGETVDLLFSFGGCMHALSATVVHSAPEEETAWFFGVRFADTFF